MFNMIKGIVILDYELNIREHYGMLHLTTVFTGARILRCVQWFQRDAHIGTPTQDHTDAQAAGQYNRRYEATLHPQRPRP